MISVLLLLSLASATQALSSGMQFEQSLLDGRLTLEWALVNGSSIEFLVTGQVTNGWVAVGVSPLGGMPGADITVGWLDAMGAPVISDRWVGSSPGEPKVDTEQNVKLVSLVQSGDKLALRFRRGLDSCDPNSQDLAISGTSRVIVAMGNGPFGKHADADRATKSIDLVRGAVVPNPTETDLKSWDVKLANAQMPGELTAYWSVAAKFPDAPAKVHAVRFEVLIPKEDLAFTHHFLLYACSTPLSTSSLSWVGNRRNEPRDVKDCVGPHPIYGWAIGGPDINMPPKVGVPIVGGQTFVLEIHIDRPQKQAVTANCGIRVIYTAQQRPHEAALIHFGARTDVWLTIPPTMGPSVRRAFCYRECTQQGIPDKTYAFAAMGHMHYAGRAFRLRHMRNNSAVELAPLIDNPTYDNQLQSFNFFSDHVELRAGDSFLIEGTYQGNSDGRMMPTFGGSSSWDEMLLAYVYAYSETGPIAMADCSSSGETDELYDDLIARQAFNGKQLMRGEEVADFIDRLSVADWVKYDTARDGAERSGKAVIKPVCYNADGRSFPISPKAGIYPQKEYAPPRVCVRLNTNDSAAEAPVVITRTVVETMSATTTDDAATVRVAIAALVAAVMAALQ